METIKKEGDKVKINITSDSSLYIDINGWTYYIDDSTNEQIMDKWVTDDAPTEKDLAEWDSDPKV